jgi:hypothetical protein
LEIAGISTLCNGDVEREMERQLETVGLFDILLHADWSVAAKKQQMCCASRVAGRWSVNAPVAVGNSEPFLDAVFGLADNHRVLLGFDFPIGLPVAYGAKTPFADFRSALRSFGEGDWERFFDVATCPAEISIRRPFYPNAARNGVSRASLVEQLEVNKFDDLMRACERRTDNSSAACSVFWTLGGNQVGKAALSGWREIVRPAVERGARVWPFDGALAALADTPGVVIAETYPAEAYRMLNSAFRPGESKRRQSDRRAKADAITTWPGRKRIDLTTAMANLIKDGFGSSSTGEDRFDAFMGLAKMIEVVEGRPEASSASFATSRWEGWILGR